MRTNPSLEIALLALAAVLVFGACAADTPANTPASNTPGTGTLGLLSGADLARVQAQILPSGSQQYGIMVNSTGSVKAVPDLGILSLTVETRADTIAPAKDEAGRAMAAILEVLKDRGVAGKDIQTHNFNIQPVYDYNRTTYPGGPSQPVIVGYIVNNGITVKVRKIDDMGTIIDEVTAAGRETIRIGYINFTLDDPKRLEAQARELALKDAIAKAHQMAKVTDVILGKPAYISESGGYPVYQQLEAAKIMSSAPATDASTPINPGESEISISVSIVFNIV